MLEVFAPIALEIASYVLKEVTSIGLTKLKEKILNSPLENPARRVEIKESEIRAKIEETLLKRDDYDKNNDEKKTQIFQQVLKELKTLSERDPDLEVVSGQIIISQQQQGEDKELDSTELKAWRERIETRLDEIAATRRTELITGTPQISDDTPPLKSLQTPESKQQKPQNKNSGSPDQPPKSKDSESLMLKNLHKYKEYGESVLRVMESLEKNQSSPKKILENPQLEDCINSLKDAANKTVELASSPVKIAVMGEFSSGKTLLIGSLIGYADALPVSEIPTTGNVTAIHLLQQEGFKTTGFENFTVEYLSHIEVQECLNFMLDQAKQRSQTSELPALPQTLNKDTQNLYEKWCELVWNKTQNPELRSLVRELIIFIRAYVSYGTDLCDQTLKITQKTAHDGLKLTSISPANQELKFQEIPELAKLSVNKNRPTPELLQNSFSLIRRVNIDVKISKQIWDFGTTQDTAKFIILDFPGLGAADSGVRDTFVSLRELAEVQTILILLNGRTPGGDRANKIFSLIQQKRPEQKLKDFILVGVGRFNQLPIESEQKVDQLIKSAANNSLTETTVFQEFSGLKTIIDQASALTSQKDRIVLLDQQIGLADLAKFSNAVKVGSQEFLSKLEDPNDISLQQSKQMREKWQNLSDRLLATDQHSPLAQQLGYFAQDGGIGKLRELLLNHVAAHSLKQLYEDTKSAANKLDQQQNHLKQILLELGISSEPSSAFKELRDAFETIYRTYNRFKDNLGEEQLKDARGVAISDVIKDEVTYRILEWSQWNLLFSIAPDGIIILPTIPKTKKKSIFADIDNPNNIPTKSDDFYEVFQNTVKDLKTFAWDCINKAVINLLENLANQLSPEIEQLKAKLRKEMITEIEKKFGKNEKYMFSIVCAAYNPKEWLEEIIEPTSEEESDIEEEESDIETVSAFPLARKDKKHESGQFFDWAPEYSEIHSPTPNQVLLVQRLRDEITASISLHTIEYLSQINKKVDEGFLTLLNTLTPQLGTLLTKEALIRYIVDEKQEEKEADPFWPILSQIASISIPDISS